MKKRLLILLLYTASAFAQNKDLALVFRPVSGDKALTLNDTFYIQGKEHVVLEALRFYVSGVQLLRDDSLVWQEKNSYHLYDLEDGKNIVLSLPSGLDYNKLRFYAGIDSLTNVSGAMGGALDPTKGMYWTWQSGYINFKAEGRSSVSSHPKKEFQLHLGGYEAPYHTLRQITLQVKQQAIIDVYFDLRQFLRAAALATRSHIMSPGPEAVKLSAVAAQCFKTKQ